jgi:hypothetical protein
MKRLTVGLLAAVIAATVVHADTHKLTDEQKRELVRGLTAEWAKAKVDLPVSKKPLPFDSIGARDEEFWKDAMYKNGPAARVNDMVQITKVKIGDDKIELELNDGSKKGSFMDHVQIGGSGGTVTQPDKRPPTAAQQGTSIEIKFPKTIGDIDATGVKKILASIMDFDKHSATETYLESLPEPTKEAIKAKKAIVGMDREQVLLALGTPRQKSRETKEDVDYEDWIYGQQPGIIRFVTFAGAKVSNIKEFYVGLNGSTAQTQPIK